MTIDIHDYRVAPGGEGPLAAEWADKPHRLVYDLCGEVERLRVVLTLTGAGIATSDLVAAPHDSIDAFKSIYNGVVVDPARLSPENLSTLFAGIRDTCERAVDEIRAAIKERGGR